MVDYNFTPDALSNRCNDASAIFLKFVNSLSEYGEDVIYCFVEGYDMPYYRSIVKNVCKKEPVEIKCNGKENVIAANEYIESMDRYKHYQKRYFVDHDFDANDNVPNTIFVTDGYSIENYYLSNECVSNILEIEFKISRLDHIDNYKKCMGFFQSEHEKFLKGTLLLNAWYSCLYASSKWNRKDVFLEDSFPKEWMSLKIGNISFNYTLSDIETKFNKAPHMEAKAVDEEKTKLQTKGYKFFRGKYEMQFLFEFLKYIQNEPKKNRIYSVASCSIPFYQNTMLSTFSQYADVSEKLYKYLEAGIQ